jgi:two-component system LytT family sensor kinase
MKQKHVILLHLFFWVLLLANRFWDAATAFTFSEYKPQPFDLYFFTKYFTIELTYLLIPITCFYGGSLLVGPLIIRKKYFTGLAYTSVIILFITTLRYVMEYHFFLPVFGFDNYRGHPFGFLRFVTNVFFYYMPVCFVYGLMYSFVLDLYLSRQQRQELEKEKAAAELTFLRSQINPHFLFNSINDIYSLTYRQSELAPVALLKLSEILRYMLSEGKENAMLLQNELKYLENVIELQRISAKGNAYINFTIEGYIGTQKIATLLLIAFVENAFKHGILTDTENPINIQLQATPDTIFFSVRNKKNYDEKDKTGGIGLTNVKRRLELIYPGNYTLTIDDTDEFYTINLELRQL